MYSPTAVPPEKFNTWRYVLESRTTPGIRRVEISLTVSTLKVHGYVSVIPLESEYSATFATQIKEELTASLGEIAKPITPEEFVELMSQEWAKAYSPKDDYRPSPAISSIVRPYADQDSLPSEVIKAIADELDTTEEIALDYGIKAKTAINQGLV